jgi:hypothetical protein
MTDPWMIADWEKNFEISQSRRRAGRLSWVAMPTRHDSRGYRRLIRSEDGVRHFACWVALVQVSARCEDRGTLASDTGVALTTEDFEAMTDIPADMFDRAIPILCAIGWIICPSRSEVGAHSEHTPSMVGAHSEHGMSTVQNNTEQDKTKQTLQDLKKAHRSIQTTEAKRIYDQIPSKRRRGYKRFCATFVEEVIDYEVDPDFVLDAILEYYKSPEGECPYFREPTRLVEDHIWEEDRSMWTRKDRNENKQSATEQEQIESIDHLFATKGQTQ